MKSSFLRTISVCFVTDVFDSELLLMDFVFNISTSHAEGHCKLQHFFSMFPNIVLGYYLIHTVYYRETGNGPSFL